MGSGKKTCPSCGGQGTAIRGEKPRFYLAHSQRGNQIDEYRYQLLQCRLCLRAYAAREHRQEFGWVFDRHTRVEEFYELPEENGQVLRIGSTASEWTKRMARGIEA